MVSNLRAERSESGIVIPNSPSRPLTKSVRANESSNPDSNSDSSAPGLRVVPLMLCRTLRIRASVSTSSSLHGRFCERTVPHFVVLKSVHQVCHQRICKRMITIAGKVRMIGLRPAGINPVLHRAKAAHALALVPVSAIVSAANLALRLDNFVGAGVGLPRVVLAQRAVCWTDNENRRLRNVAVNGVDQIGERVAVARLVPQRARGLVGSVGQNDERGRIIFEILREELLIPLENQRSLCAVDADHLPSHAGLRGDPSEQRDGSVVGGLHLKVMISGWARIAKRSGADRRSLGLDRNRVAAIIGKQQAAAAGLLQILQFERRARRIERNPFVGPLRADADSPHAQLAFAEIEKFVALRLPAGRLRMLRPKDAEASERIAGIGVADAAVTILLLDQVARLAGKNVRGGVRVAPLQHAQRIGGLFAGAQGAFVRGELRVEAAL